MTAWFGDPWPRPDWRAPACENEALHVPVPVGRACMYCEEVIVDGDRGFLYPGYLDVEGFVSTALPAHLECSIRSVMGCSGQLAGTEHTHGGSYRADARKVLAWLNERDGTQF